MKGWWLLGLVVITLALYGCGLSPADGTEDVSIGETGSLYPPQDLSIIAKTNRVQFLNVYANW